MLYHEQQLRAIRDDQVIWHILNTAEQGIEPHHIFVVISLHVMVFHNVTIVGGIKFIYQIERLLACSQIEIVKQNLIFEICY